MTACEYVSLASPERRRREDRRSHHVRVAVERRRGDRRQRGAADPAREQEEFQRAMEQLCRLVRYPNCRHVLQVAHGMGYRRMPTGAGPADGASPPA